MGCAVFDPPVREETPTIQNGNPVANKPQFTVENKPSPAEKTIENVANQWETHGKPVADATGFGTIGLGISTILATLYAISKDVRERRYAKLTKAIQKKDGNHLPQLLAPDTDTSVRKFADSLVGEA